MNRWMYRASEERCSGKGFSRAGLPTLHPGRTGQLDQLGTVTPQRRPSASAAGSHHKEPRASQLRPNRTQREALLPSPLVTALATASCEHTKFCQWLFRHPPHISNDNGPWTNPAERRAQNSIYSQHKKPAWRTQHTPTAPVTRGKAHL